MTVIPSNPPKQVTSATFGQVELRDYQLRLVRQVQTHLHFGKNPFVVAPTGSGKMVIIAALAKALNANVLVLEHRKELVAQAVEKLAIVGANFGTIAAKFKAKTDEIQGFVDVNAAIRVAMIQTLSRRETGDWVPKIIVIDEAHLCVASTYREILRRYPNAQRVALSATPLRLDGLGFKDICDVMVQGPTIKQLVALGHLVPTNIYSTMSPNLDGVRTRGFDYDVNDLAEKFDQEAINNEVVRNWLELAKGRSTIVFATSVSHSRHLRDSFRAAGVTAEHIDGGTPDSERDEIIDRIRAGQVKVLCNCNIVIEGFDAPIVSCVVLVRATKSLGLYMQAIGRGMRPHPESGKTNLVVLDFGGNEAEHRRPDVDRRWSLDGKPPSTGFGASSNRIVTTLDSHSVQYGGAMQPPPPPPPVQEAPLIQHVQPASQMRPCPPLYQRVGMAQIWLQAESERIANRYPMTYSDMRCKLWMKTGR